MSDRTAFVTVNLSAALVSRTIPTIITWNRLEGRPRTLNFNRALKAEVRDALWMLTKQWQLGEFQGDDAASPIEAKVRLTQSRLRNYAAGAGGTVEQFDETIPMETKVERRPVAFSLELQLLMGRQWLKMLPVPSLRSEYIREYPIHAPDPTKAGDAGICAHQEAWSEFAANAGRSMDGAAFYQHLKGGGKAADDINGGLGHAGELDPAATRFIAWFETLIAPPSGPDAWIPHRLEYRFACPPPAPPPVSNALLPPPTFHTPLHSYS